MKAEYINPFLTGTLTVLKTFAFTEAAPGAPYLKKEQRAEGDISGVVGFTGELSGSLSLSFPKASICAIVSNMYGKPYTMINGDVQDAVGQITGMICGEGLHGLTEQGVSLQASPPTVVGGLGHQVKHWTAGPVIAIPFSTKAGSFLVEVSLGQ